MRTIIKAKTPQEAIDAVAEMLKGRASMHVKAAITTESNGRKRNYQTRADECQVLVAYLEGPEIR